MRISDWSSDVCSSDLQIVEQPFGFIEAAARDGRDGALHMRFQRRIGMAGPDRPDIVLDLLGRWHGLVRLQRLEQCIQPAVAQGDRIGRSEEHTSELQSLMRISYAVFFLKKKK